MKNGRFINWFILILLALIWGSSFILMKRGLYNTKGLPVLTYDQVATLRLLIASAVLLPFLFTRKALAVFKKNWVALLVVGVAGNGLPAFLFAAAQTKIDSGIAGILNSTVPLLTLLIGLLFFKSRPNWKHVLGVIIGFIGIVGLLYSSKVGQRETHIGYALLIILATIGYGISVNTIKKYLNDVSSRLITAMALFFIGPFCGFYLFSTDFTNRVLHIEGGWAALFYTSLLAILGTALALILFNQLVKNTSALSASTVTYLIPIVAVAWGFIDGESITLLHLLFGAIILSAVYLIRRE